MTIRRADLKTPGRTIRVSRRPMATPQDLASALSAALVKKREASPPLEELIELFEVMYVASLQTEEGRPVRFAIAYMDPARPDPRPPEYPPQDRWSCTVLNTPRAWTVASLVKLSMASDPRSSSLAVFKTDEGLRIWGLVDQQGSYHDYVNQNTDVGPERPGLFQAQVEGPAHIRAFMGYRKVSELRVDRIVGRSVDVLHAGPIRARLAEGIRWHFEDVRERLDPEEYDVDSYWQSSFADKWLAALSRILLRVQNYRHGGTNFIPAGDDLDGLNVKYGLAYPRLRRALADRAAHLLRNTMAGEMVIEDFMEKDVETMPVWLHVENEITTDDLDGSLRELDGATRFVSLLTRVDGVVLVTPALDIIGFGVEITEQGVPDTVMLANTRTATDRSLRALDYYQYGTRHRSVMRYCWAHPGSTGFVVSQDGDVRAIARVGDQVVLWDDIKLRVEFDFARETRAHHRAEPVGKEAPLPVDGS